MDRYEIGPVIGRGAGGVIHRARDHDLARDVAMKLLSREGSSPSERVRFVVEAQVPAQLEHPNIIPVHDVGKTADGDLFYVMKLVEGDTLKQLLADDRPEHELLDVLYGVAKGIAFAHHRGFLHRDLKPSNVMVGAFGEVLVLDWGLARAPQGATVRDDAGPMSLDGDVMGTLGYMAPEQALGEVKRQGPATDVHALGAMLHEILTGAPPRPARTLVELIPQLNRLPAPASGPLGALALRCLAPDPLARPRDAGEFEALLDLSR
ncbi:MAG: serine/threonine protein kinase [Proteobacteria bacterium]|nr:serine/threonine protein kinase [Pseudomonadota bacterium]MCP4915537.1 serine/threonine protein kinase [Pseudomonadota bacterium]